MRVLVIEDDRETAAHVVKGLGESGYVVDHAADGDNGLKMALSRRYDVVIVDRMLPKRDGLAVIAALRAEDCDAPVLILSALDRVDERVRGLRAGGDDYLPKPYAFSELLARVEALVRRAERGSGDPLRLSVGGLEMDLISRKVTRAGRAIALKPREFQLLEYLMRHAGQVVTRTMLLEGVWNYHFDPQTNVIDVHISRLRQKVDRDFDVAMLETVRGAGYRLAAAAADNNSDDAG